MVTGPFQGHTRQVLSVAYSPETEGSRIVSAAGDNTVCVWDAKSGELLNGPFEGHTASVLSAAFSPDGRHIVSGSDDHTVRIWDVESEKIFGGPLLRLNNTSAYHLLNVSFPLTFSPSLGSLTESQLIHTRNPARKLHWEIHQGWVSCNSSDLLFWLPSPHRFGLWSPHNTVVISCQQTLLSYENFVHGSQWAQCYEPNLST
ncbi:WD40-repeat-containing domain protein [Mycena latifolia]|nr:WD40-repeat-containing domain protein [Mycena latifolia]